MMLSYRNLWIFLLTLCLSVIGHNELQAFSPDKGMFLVAKDQLGDPRFRDRVILLIQHDTEGSAGLVVNRISRLSLAAILPQGSKLVEPGRMLSYGGPVEPQTLLALVKVRNNPPQPAEEVIDGLYVTGVGVLDEWPDFADEVVEYRAFVGYTGWAPGQLNAELQRGDWHVMPADEANLFAGDGVQLWERLRAAAREKD